MNERSIFLEALAKETLAQRVAYLKEACGDDVALRQRVEALLASQDVTTEFVGKPVSAPPDRHPVGNPTWRSIFAAELCANRSLDGAGPGDAGRGGNAGLDSAGSHCSGGGCCSRNRPAPACRGYRSAGLDLADDYLKNEKWRECAGGGPASGCCFGHRSRFGRLGQRASKRLADLQLIQRLEAIRTGDPEKPGEDDLPANNKVKKNGIDEEQGTEYVGLELSGPTVDGKIFDLRQFRGKVVLIDFWATWCGPCVAEMPNVKRVYNRYHQDGFEVMGVSLDNSREALVKYLKTKEISWPQLFFDAKGSQGWNSPLAKKFDVHAIPATILVDRQGKVAAKDVRGEALEPAVARLLGKTIAPPSEAASAGQSAADFRVTEVSLKAEPKVYSGPSPAKFEFVGKIKTNGPGLVKYTFLRSDYAQGPTFTLKFDKAGVEEVNTSWQLGGKDKFAGWEVLKILAPNEMSSEKAQVKIERDK